MAVLNFQFLNWTLRFLSAISFDAFHFQGKTSFLKPSKHIRSTTIDRVKDNQNNLEIFFQQQKMIASKANAWPGKRLAKPKANHAPMYVEIFDLRCEI